MVFDLHAENVNKISTASRFFVIKNKIKNPRPASNFLGRPAKPAINFTWPHSCSYPPKHLWTANVVETKNTAKSEKISADKSSNSRGHCHTCTGF